MSEVRVRQTKMLDKAIVLELLQVKEVCSAISSPSSPTTHRYVLSSYFQA